MWLEKFYKFKWVWKSFENVYLFFVCVCRICVIVDLLIYWCGLIFLVYLNINLKGVKECFIFKLFLMINDLKVV